MVGKRTVTFIISNDNNDVPYILSTTTKDFDLSYFDTRFLEDEGFTNIDLIPKRVGLYEIECEHSWDDGRGYFETIEPDWQFAIQKAIPLYQV